ncbi:MAG: serine hydrolase [Candidatus Eremiobacteraeota bacterium]|nr:serine hydrolase [Candidatus Eremiobacteraeota bacterium]
MNRRGFAAGAAAAATLLLAPQCAPAAPTLRSRVASLAKTFPGAIGVYAQLLGSDEPLVAYRAYETFPTASTIKLLIMATAYAFDELQPGMLDRRVTFHSSDLIAGSDFMSTAKDGQEFTVRELIVPMIHISDNTAANMLVDYFGIDSINETAREAGMTQTRLGTKFLDWYAVVRHSVNVSTPADLAHLLYAIERGAHEDVRTIASPEHCRTMIDVMLGQTDRDGIPAALPPGTPVANKTGEITGTRDDTAIVEPYGQAPWVIVIMTKAAYDYNKSYDAIHAITRETYDAVKSS